MKIAYLILCHKNPEQINRMINALSYRDVHFYVHVDKKSSIVQSITKREDIFFVDNHRRIDVQWGHFSIVDAMLILLKTVVESYRIYDYVWFISGQDYPIFSSEKIICFLEKHSGINFVNSLQEGALYRRFFKRNMLWYPNWLISQKLLTRILLKVYIMLTGGYHYTFSWTRRKGVFPQKYFFGSQWLTITHEAAVYILNYLENNPQYFSYFRYALIPEESFFQTILFNSPFKESISDYLCYVDWSKHKKNPKTLTAADYDALTSSSYLVARKLDSSVDTRILDLLDTREKNKSINFSVLMSVCRKDDPEALRIAINSIFHQTRMPHEVILVQDGPLTPALDSVIVEISGRYSSLLKTVALPTNVGLPAALNAGMKVCSCELIARMDSDDISLPHRFERQFGFLDVRPDIDILSAWIEERDERMEHTIGIREVPVEHRDIARFARWRNPLNHVAVVYRKSAVMRASGYPEDLIGFEDYGLWMKLMGNGCRFANIPEPLIYVRTGSAFLLRRGGLRYFFQEVRLLCFGLKIGFYSPAQFLLLILVRPIARLLPSSILKKVYAWLRCRSRYV